MNAPDLYLSTLNEELAKRCAKNPRYSIRAFARALELTSGALSQILAGKRVPSYKMAQRILSSLDLTPEQEDDFLASLAASHRSRGLKRLSPVFRRLKRAPQIRELSVDLFRIIADWHHYAILELTFVEGFESNPQWIARALGLGVVEVKLALKRLGDLGLIELQDGRWVKTDSRITTADKQLTSPALRRHQRQVIEKSLHSLENDPIEARSMSSMTMAIDPTKLPEAKARIDAFTHELCNFLETGTRTQVYELGIALFPLQQLISKPTTKPKGTGQ